jgi:ribosome maturation factor RimP
MTEVIEKIQALVIPLLEGTDMFVVNIRIKPTNNIKLFLDSDSGLSIEKSAMVNRKLYALLEASGLFPDGDFSLEVSSPGVDEPLAQHRQYRKNVGRKLTVTLVDGAELTGLLKEVDDESLTLEIKGAKQKEPVVKNIPLADIQKAVVQVTF